LILVPGVTENRDDGLVWATFPGKTNSACNIDPAGKSEKETFFAQKLVNSSQGRLVINPVSFVNGNAFDVLRHPSLADSFDYGITVIGIDVTIGEPGPHRRAIGVGANGRDGWVLFL